MAEVITFSNPSHPMHAAVQRRRSRTTSTVGTRIHSALEAAGHAGTLTGKCRNYLNVLNFPQRHDAEAITERLLELLQFECVQNVRRERKVPVQREAIDLIVFQALVDEATANPQPQRKPVTPDVSTIGTDIRRAIESAAACKITCGPCSAYLISLNKSLAPDIDAVTQNLLTLPDIPIEFRRSIGPRVKMEAWLKSIVQVVINEK